MKCANHPDRGGILAIDLPSINVRTFLCLECRIELNDRFAQIPNERKQNPWPGIWEQFGGRSGMTDSAYHNPNSIYERAQANNKDIINDK